jgi:hypothetical protein
MPAEHIEINYNHRIAYNNTDLNAIGATTNLTLRTITAPAAGTTNYVRKFGADYLIKQVTDMTLTGDANMTFRVYAADGTLLGTSTNAAFTAGATLTTAQSCYLEIEANGGAVVVITPITIDTDVDAGGLAFVCAAETIADGDTLRLYLSDTSSTYYDANYMYGGARHTPAVGDSRLPYFHPEAADTALAARTIVHVLDSATYEVSEYAISGASTIWQAALGQTPTITSGVGARVSREVSVQYNNVTAVYFNENGNDANPGTWQEPKLTIAGAIAARVAHDIIYGGTGATVSGGIFSENITIAAAYLLEPDYGYIPSVNAIQITNVGGEIYGFITTQITSGISLTGNIQDNTVHDFVGSGVFLGAAAIETDLNGGNILRNHIYGSSIGIQQAQNASVTGTIEKNIIHDGVHAGGILAGIIMDASGGRTNSINVRNNVIYNNYEDGLYLYTHTQNLTGNIENNTIYNNNQYGIYAEENAGGNITTVRNNIIWNNTTFDLYLGAGAVTITESNYGTNSGFTIGAGCITTDPEFCYTTLPYKFGISANSGAYRTDTSSDDMGAHLRCIEINNSDITINGFYIDGQEQYNNAIFIVDNAGHTGTIIKWNNIFDYQGQQIDLYGTADTDATITNNKIYNGGNAIRLAYGGNTVQENLIYNNSIFGIWTDWTIQEFIHNVFYGNQYGIYLESNSAGITIRDCIFDQNSSYGIYSEVALVITYCDILDAVNSNVNITAASNLTDNPLFVNTNEGAEDFHIKTIEGGYVSDSACKESASDGKDIGAFDVSYSVANDYWKLYELAYNPKVMDFGNRPKGAVQFTDAEGGLDNWAKAHKRVFGLAFGQNQYTTEVLRNKLKLFSVDMMRKRENTYVDSQTIFRVHFQPTTYLESGTGTVDGTGKTIQDITQDWTENKFKGWHVGVQYTSGVGTGTLAAVARTLTVNPSPVWTVNQWIGYYFHYAGNYYYILSNTADILTLSDPLGNLVNDISIDWEIEKYFKIISNIETSLCVSDDDDELPTGSYEYYIDFIECKVQRPEFSFNQDIYLWTREHSKKGFAIIFEEV